MSGRREAARARNPAHLRALEFAPGRRLKLCPVVALSPCPRKSLSSLTIDLPGGRTLGPATRPAGEGEDASIRLFEEIGPRSFPVCPICGSPATTEEHVPPKRMGGQKMTRTCDGCNHRLGSNVEGDLWDWVDVAITQARFSSTNVQGARGAGRILRRTTPAGESELVVEGKYDPDVRDMLQGGEVELAGLLPDWNRVNLALLKHAYLAACMRYGMLEGEVADQIRADLVAARDADGPQNVPTSALALGQRVSRGGEPTPGIPPLVRAIAQEADGPGPGVVLGGWVFVSWYYRIPADEKATPQRRQLNVPFTVGRKADGTVSSTEP